MKNTVGTLIIIGLFLLYAFPIPVSLAGIPFSLIHIGSVFLPESPIYKGTWQNKLNGDIGGIIFIILFMILMIFAKI